MSTVVDEWPHYADIVDIEKNAEPIVTAIGRESIDLYRQCSLRSVFAVLLRRGIR
jgi:hypothetical protein